MEKVKIGFNKEISIMSGHSKWASIKHKKAAVDAKRGKIFSKIAKEISVAARSGGDLDTNASLRTIVNKARSVNMPADNIDRAIKKGTGELPGVVYEEHTYEAYGPGGVAIIIEVLTDNKNRAVAEIRNILSKRNGSMAGGGSVNWLFKKKGLITVAKTTVEEDKLMGVALEAGAEDMTTEEEAYSVICEPHDFENVKKVLEAAEIAVQTADLTMIPDNTVKLEGSNARQVLNLIEDLEDNDDVQNVYANFDIADDVFDEIEKSG